MKKNIALLILFFVSGSFMSNAQVKLDDFGRIVLNTYLPEDIELPEESKKILLTKLNQIISINGIGGGQVNPRFILTANVNVGTKDIISGPPQLIAQNLEVTLYVGDAISNTIFSTTSVSLKGIANNENKAFIDALKTINPKNKEISKFLEDGKTKIISFYSTNCDFIIKNSQVLAKQEKFDEAIYTLSLVPEVCKDCYFKCLDTLTAIYQQKIDADCKLKFNKAKVIWASAQTPNGAELAGDVLSTINPIANCQSAIAAFIKVIDTKLKADERARWQFKIKQYQDKIAIKKESMRVAEERSKRNAIANEKRADRNFELDKMRINSFREVAATYAKNQPKSLTNNYIYWK